MIQREFDAVLDRLSLAQVAELRRRIDRGEMDYQRYRTVTRDGTTVGCIYGTALILGAWTPGGVSTRYNAMRLFPALRLFMLSPLENWSVHTSAGEIRETLLGWVDAYTKEDAWTQPS